MAVSIREAQDAAMKLGDSRTDEILGGRGLSSASEDALRRLIAEANRGSGKDAKTGMNKSMAGGGAMNAQEATVETHGQKALKALHMGLHRLHKATSASMGGLDECEAKAHLNEHVGGMAKALKAIGKAHSKFYKADLPDDYPEEEPPVEAPAAPVEGSSASGAPDASDTDMVGDEYENVGLGDEYDATGVRPRDEAMMDAMDGKDVDADEMSDEDAMELKKALDSLERDLGLAYK